MKTYFLHVDMIKHPPHITPLNVIAYSNEPPLNVAVQAYPNDMLSIAIA